MHFHRPEIQDVFAQLRFEREQQLKPAVSSSTIVLFGNRPETFVSRLDYVNVQLKVISAEQIERRAKKVGIITAHEHFKDRFRLSLKDGKFCAFEHIDENPLFINNFGMASKLKRYVYADKYLPSTAFLGRSENQGLKHMGPYGVQIRKRRGEKIPLLG